MEATPVLPKKRNSIALVIPALGVVFGDIGTSPLYALREAFHGSHGFSPTPDNVLGILSLVFWTLIIVISLKYLMFVMRADNKGEGGVLALMALAIPHRTNLKGAQIVWLFLGLFGATLLFGDGAITPAITVLGAVEGINVVTPIFEHMVIPISVVILTGVFWAQKFGTHKIGSVFGPLMLLWFLTLAALGLRGIAMHPDVLNSMNPYYAVNFFSQHSWNGLIVLGAVFLVATGGEALFADMGHFGKESIRIAWFAIALPGLLLNYFGQGALILSDPSAVESPFFRLAPEWASYPLLVLATIAAVIASQALISGVFSLTRQAIQLGYLPRIQTIHTSVSEIGQIYIPKINKMLFILTIWLLLEFKTSSDLAAAYGIAVSATMVITTVLAAIVAYNRWHWHPLKVTFVVLALLVVDLIFFGANSSKIADGGWVPLVLGVAIFTIMTTWKRGRAILVARLVDQSMPVEKFCAELKMNPPVCVPGTAIFMSGDPEGTPPCLLHNLRHNKIIHKQVFITAIITEEEAPYIDEKRRVEITQLSENIFRIIGRYGFMEMPNINDLLGAARKKGFVFEFEEVTFFLGRETILSSDKPGMARWREALFSFLSRNAERATAFFNIPPTQVVEIGTQIEI